MSAVYDSLKIGVTTQDSQDPKFIAMILAFSSERSVNGLVLAAAIQR
jgi:hypothetical protein